MKRLLALLTVLATCSLIPVSAAGAQSHIIGGHPAAAGAFPWTAFVMASLGGDNAEVCGGSVVAPNWILTAGHCAEDLSTDRPYAAAAMSVVTGTVDWTEAAAGQVATVSRVVVHPSYDPKTDAYDAALLQLSAPTAAPAIPLAGPTSAGTAATVAGWGLTSSSAAATVSNVLEWGLTAVLPNSYCGALLPGFDPATQLCAEDAPSFGDAVCEGDSGSPLVVGSGSAATEIGLVNEGAVGCPANEPTYFLRADAISGWVRGWAAAVPPPARPAATPSAPATATATATKAGPALGGAQARAKMVRVLRHALGSRYTHRSGYRASCRRRSAASFACSARWRSGGYAYAAAVTVSGSTSSGRLRVSDRYVIRRTPSRCTRGCRVLVRRGS